MGLEVLIVLRGTLIAVPTVQSATQDNLLLGPAKDSTRLTIGRCGCEQDRSKFRTRRTELLQYYARLTAADSNCCLNPGLVAISHRQHKARAVLEEIFRIEAVLEVLEKCKHVFSTAPCCESDHCSCNNVVNAQTSFLQRSVKSGNHCYDFNKAMPDSYGRLPEFLLEPMRKAPRTKIPIPKFPDISSFHSENCYEVNDATCSARKCGQSTMRHEAGQSGRSWTVRMGRPQVPKCVTPRCPGQVHCWKGSCRNDGCSGQCQCAGSTRTENCVTVFGFSRDSIITIVQCFSVIGDLTWKRLPPRANWAVFCYRFASDASQACRYDLSIIDGRIISVVRCKPDVADGPDPCLPFLSSDAQPETGIVRARKNLRLYQGKIIESSGNPAVTPRRQCRSKFTFFSIAFVLILLVMSIYFTTTEIAVNPNIASAEGLQSSAPSETSRRTGPIF